MRKKKLNNRIIQDFLTFTLLFSMFVNTIVFAIDGSDPVRKTLVDVTEVLLVVAGLVCVGKLIQIGIKYMMTSVEEKSNAKAAILPWLVGTVVCFGAASIGKFIINILDTHQSNVLDY